MTKKEDGTIVPIPGRLIYRGIDLDALAAEADANDRFMFEEVVWLLLFGFSAHGTSMPSSANCWRTTANCPAALPTI